MVHIIVDKHMNKINKYRTIAKGYRIAAQRFWLLPIPEFKISRIKNNSIHLIKNYIKKETTKLRQGWKRASRKDPKGEGGRHNKITQEKTLKSISEIRLLEQKRSGVHTKGIIAIIGFQTIFCKHNTTILYKFYHIFRREQKKNVFLNDFKDFLLLKSSEISFQVLISAKEGSNSCSFLVIFERTKERESD